MGSGEGPVISVTSTGRNITGHTQCRKPKDDPHLKNHTGTLNKMILFINLWVGARDLSLLPLHPDQLSGPSASYSMVSGIPAQGYSSWGATLTTLLNLAMSIKMRGAVHLTLHTWCGQRACYLFTYYSKHLNCW